jgi:hypothetical protein
MRDSHPEGKGGEALMIGGDGGSVLSITDGGDDDLRVSIVTGLRGNVTINADSFSLNRYLKISFFGYTGN